ncbi:hypothetical protein F5I97DRAFT_1893225 [Phlebopus sp. FC_14]|nr:hypothetical protein F5I97DRAFT_1893225 [Phlebopus sp. FC_14]
MSQAESEAIVMAFIDSVHPSFNFVVGITAFCACLVTLLVVLFAFSTPESRRRTVFRLNVLAIVIALVLGILNGVTSGRAILAPFDPIPQSVYVATISFALLPPIFYDSILLTRLLAFFPIDTTPPFTLIKVLAFPVCVKCGRLITLSLYLNDYVKSSPSVASLAAHAEATWFRNPYITAEWTMQMFDNLYVIGAISPPSQYLIGQSYSSGFFLYKLYSQNSRIAPVRSGSIGERIRQIFYIAAANFVFPVMFNIAQIVCITTDPSYGTGTMLLLVNGYVSVLGVLCATIWFSGMEWVRAQGANSAFVASQPSSKTHGTTSYASERLTIPRPSDANAALLQSSHLSDEFGHSRYRYRDVDHEKGFPRGLADESEPSAAFPLKVLVQSDVRQT